MTRQQTYSAEHFRQPAARSLATRVLHLALLLMVLHQLFGSNYIRMPFPGDAPSTMFMLHEYIGIASVGLIMLFWAWAVVRQGETELGRLLPWFSWRRLRAVGNDLRDQVLAIAGGQAPHDEDGALASAVHGLGLLAVTATIATGMIYYLTPGSPYHHAALIAHKLISNLSWGYLIAHAGLAVIHHLLGSNILSRMFWFRRRLAR